MKFLLFPVLALGLAACAEGAGKAPSALSSTLPVSALSSSFVRDAYPSTYAKPSSKPVAVVGATVLTATGAEIAGGTALFADGKIMAVGRDIAVPEGYVHIDGRGKWLTPGVIDAHSHLGAWGQPDTVAQLSDANEMTDPNTAGVWVEHAIWPLDPGFDRAREAGVTTLMVFPGSANLFGGRTVTIKNVPSETVQGMKFPGAPYGVKIACGENPRRFYGGLGRAPATRMGNVAGYRKAWIDASEYRKRWAGWEKGGRVGAPPKRDLQLETLAGVLQGEILVHNHCYRADEMANMIDVAEEFGFRVQAFHHANEAYKIAPMLVRSDICVASWTSWWGYKMEVFDAIEANVPMIHGAGGCAIIHSDDPIGIQHLNQEAAATLSAAWRAGMPITKADAIKWFTANPARALGIADTVGTLEEGKNADAVLWDADPFSIYARPDKVWIDGGLVFERANAAYRPRSDFMLGQPGGPR